MAQKQKRLGMVGSVIIIICCNIIAPLSTDMYMPALPEMAAFFHASDAIMNLTLIGFFFAFAFGMLVFGPISDRYGRKPVLTFGVGLYTIMSILCTLAGSLPLLITARIIQALGAGCMVAVSVAMVKELFHGKVQGRVLSISQTFSGLGPIIGPPIGALLFHFFGWRSIFALLIITGAIILILCFLLEETLPAENRLTGNVMSSYLRLGYVLQNRRFSIFLISMVIVMVPMMAFISASSYIFQNTFNLSPTAYSIYFAITSLTAVLGPIIYMMITGKNPFALSFALFVICFVSGLLMLVFGHVSPLSFAVLEAPAMFIICCTRPFAAEKLLNMQSTDIGSASAVFNFTQSMFGGVGMLLITSVWSDYIHGISEMLIICSIIGFCLCFYLLQLYGKSSLKSTI